MTYIEKNPMHCEYLRRKGYNPINTDFLEFTTDKKMDVIIMNPPFSEECEHIKHAYEFLKEDGILITVASNTILNRSCKKNKEFFKWFNDVEGSQYSLPPNSFKESGTGVYTKLLVFF